jgi:hypothetical protein
MSVKIKIKLILLHKKNNIVDKMALCSHMSLVISWLKYVKIKLRIAVTEAE